MDDTLNSVRLKINKFFIRHGKYPDVLLINKEKYTSLAWEIWRKDPTIDLFVGEEMILPQRIRIRGVWCCPK